MVGNTTENNTEGERGWYLKILEEVLKDIPDIIGVYKKDLTIIFYNQAGYNFYKKSSEDIKEKGCQDILSRSENCSCCYLEKVVNNKKQIRVERYVQELNKYMECIYNPILDNSGEVDFIVEQLRDITDRKVLENNIKESEERYRKIINLSPEPIIITVDNKIQLANNQACRLVATEYANLIGQSIYKYIHKESLSIVHNRMKKMLYNEKTKVINDYRIACYDKKIIDVEVSSSYLTYKGKPAVQSVIRDITEMKKGLNQAARIQKQGLQKEFPIPEKAAMTFVYKPAKTVSGDFFRLCRVKDNIVVGILGDVSGKGITAALSISAFNVLFHEALLVSSDPLEIANNLNKKVEDYLDDRYIAACCFSLDFNIKKARVVGAGINRFIVQKNNKICEEKIIKGPFLGMFKDSLFDEEIIDFDTGDKFYFFTDGLDFLLEDSSIKKNHISKYTIGNFKKYLNDILNNELTEPEGLKDDCTLLALQIK